MALSALMLNCTLKPSPAPSSCQKMLDLIGNELDKNGVETQSVRVADLNVKPGVSHDEGDGDDWPRVKAMVDAADILVMGTPIWMGSPSSICKRVCERLDAYLSDTDDKNRMATFGKVAIVGVVGNEDGAHHVSAECYQWLNDVGFTIPAGGVAYWVGEAMQATDFMDLPSVPEKVQGTVKMAASNATHLAGALKTSQYKGY